MHAGQRLLSIYTNIDHIDFAYINATDELTNKGKIRIPLVYVNCCENCRTLGGLNKGLFSFGLGIC